MTPRFSNFVLAGFASLALGSAALAGGLQAPGSLLIFPLFDNSRGFHTFITVTNSADHNPGGGTASVRVEYVYIRHEEQFLPGGALNPAFALDCTEFNRTRVLTPQDTLTVDTKTDNPNQTHQGYVYVFAKNAANAAISFNFLMGEVRVASANAGESYEMQAFTYKAIGAENAIVDAAPGTGHLDLNNTEYEAVQDLLLFPRFTGQNTGALDQMEATSTLVLIALTGGSQFTSIVDLFVYNDNEEAFSAQTSVRCWQSRELSDISSVFTDSFLLSTGQTVTESLDNTETGWFTAHGLIASSSSTTLQNPAILGVLLETLLDDQGGTQYAEAGGAVIPYGTGVNTTGRLLSHALNGS